MKRALARVALLAASTLSLYALALAMADRLPGVDVKAPLPIGWTGAFVVAVAFAAWNVWDALLDARAAYVLKRPARTRAGGLWRLRSDLLQGACCTAMAGAGALVIVQWGTVELRTIVILGAALMIVTNQIWNRIDRERVTRMPATDHDALYHAVVAEVRRAEAAAAAAAGDKHAALSEAAGLRGYVRILQRVLLRHGIEVPLADRFPPPPEGES